MHAPHAVVMGVIADVPKYPEWVSAAKSCQVLESYPDGRAKRVTFVLDAGIVKDEYTLEYRWSDDERVVWDLVRGQMQKRQHGEYTLVPQGAGTQVTYTLAVELNIP